MPRPSASLIACLLASGCSSAATSPRPLTAVIPAAELRADVELMRRAVEEGMPRLDRWRSRASIDSSFRALADTASRAMTAGEFWPHLARTVASVRDAHFSALPSQEMITAVYQQGRVMPVRLRIVEGRPFALRNYGSPRRMPHGSELTEINGMTGAEFVAFCASQIAIDGEARTRVYRRLEREIEIACIPSLGVPSHYVVKFRAPDGRTGTDTLKTVTWAERGRLVAASSAADVARPVARPGTLVFSDGRSIATMTVRTLSKGDGFSPGAFFRDAFKAIRDSGASTLILDLRENGGGRDGLGAELVSHVARDTFTYARRVIARRHFKFLEGTDEHWMNWRIKFTISTRPITNGLLQLNEALDKVQKPRRDAFRGRMIVVADRSTFSTAAEVVALLQHQKRATIVGEELPNARAGDSGATVSYVLPATRFILSIPLVAYELPGGEAFADGRAITPDVIVQETIADLMAGRDSMMDAALRIARTRP